MHGFAPCNLHAAKCHPNSNPIYVIANPNPIYSIIY